MSQSPRSLLDEPARWGRRLVKCAEDLDTDKLSGPLQRLVAKCVQPTAVRNALSGTVIGHPLHPLLTDVPIGAWVSAGVLDLVGGRKSRKAAKVLVGVGAAAAVPTALAGLNDWGDTYGPETRIGFAHGAGMTSALLLYLASWRARACGHHFRGRLWGFAGLGTTVASAYLGGHLSFGRAMVVNHTAFEERPADWTDVAADADVVAGQAVKVTAGSAAVLLYRDGGELHALANTCSHLGGPLDEGSFADGCVTCPWHGSIFRLADGSIVRGPATAQQPVYETRVVDGRIEVRAAG